MNSSMWGVCLISITFFFVGCSDASEDPDDGYSILTECGSYRDQPEEIFDIDAKRVVVGSTLGVSYHRDGSVGAASSSCDGAILDEEIHAIGSVDSDGKTCRLSLEGIDADFIVQIPTHDQPSVTAEAYRPSGGELITAKQLKCTTTDRA